MSPLASSAQDLNWLITNFVERVPTVAHAIVVSADGLPLAFSAGFPEDRADQLAAEALSVSPGVPIIRCAARRRASTKNALISLAQHAMATQLSMR